MTYQEVGELSHKPTGSDGVVVKRKSQKEGLKPGLFIGFQISLEVSQMKQMITLIFKQKLLT